MDMIYRVLLIIFLMTFTLLATGIVRYLPHHIHSGESLVVQWLGKNAGPSGSDPGITWEEFEHKFEAYQCGHAAIATTNKSSLSSSLDVFSLAWSVLKHHASSGSYFNARNINHLASSPATDGVTPPGLNFPKPAQSSKDTDKGSFPTPNTTPETWDGWLNGALEADFTWEELDRTGDFRVHWARKDYGSQAGVGDALAEHWSEGKKNTQSCLGVILCNNNQCSTIIRPHTVSGGIQRQLLKRCRCGGELQHLSCAVKMVIWTWRGGKHLQNIGSHNHDRITHLLHLLPGEQTRFEELVDNNPDATPSQLLVGRHTLHGKRKPASDISSVYNNRDRIAKDRQRVINGVKYSGGDSFVSGFRDFHHDFPGFIVHAVFGEINMICLQNEFMWSRLGGGFKRHMEPVNGIVSDAAYGFWRERNSLLITSSIYEAELHCWIPVLFSYSDGASSEHYMHHFLPKAVQSSSEHFPAVKAPRADFDFCFGCFRRWRALSSQYPCSDACQANGVTITDQYFIGILDFSQAERGGFMAAFVAFWMQQLENEHSEDELYRAAEVLLRGCEEHFRASVTRIKKIHGVVPVHSETHFEELALGLLSAKDLGDFHARAEVIQRDFPLSNSWLGWWLCDSVATMLFETHTRMEPDEIIFVWSTVHKDNTSINYSLVTNAQEAQHWKLYSAVGHDHGLLEGLEALHAVAETTVKLFTANLEGGLIHYGKAEPWKAMINLIGRSKPSRAPGGQSPKQNSDGRPPDTKKDLLSKIPKTPKKAKESQSTHCKNPVIGPASYRWDNMSCWADSAWNILYRSIVKDWASFSSRFDSDTQTEQPIRDFYNLMLLQQDAESKALVLKVPDYDLSAALSDQCDRFRRHLAEWRILKSDHAVGNVFDWFPRVLKDKLNNDLDDNN
ncbi:hypothetical protein EV359DRAFT_66693 [Lentinula novae-zelandiae]|nr:hypothetical protein EV359DRAFT_66693 [Lentinula novae-zelandiae]